MLEVTLLGTGGSMPLKNRHLSSCMLRSNGSSILIDCGEGTQIAIKECGLTFKPIDAIFITHFHADHVSGLPGLLLSMGNEGRTERVTIIGPIGVQRVVNSLRVIAPELPFGIDFLELDSLSGAFKIKDYVITPFKLYHTMECFGCVVEIARLGKFIPKKALELGIPMDLWGIIQKAGSVSYGDMVYTRDMVMGEPRKGLKFCYCTDTRPVPVIEEMAKNADLFVCEGMYADEEKLERAVVTRHMLFSDAINIAKNAKVKRLWLTHYSPSLIFPELNADVSGIEEAVCGIDGMRTMLKFED